MSEEKSKSRKVEWSFSFENLGESLTKMLDSLGLVGDEDIKTASFSEPLGEAKSARIKLDMSIGEASVKALPADSPNLIEAEVTYVGEIEFVVRPDGDQKQVRLGQVTSSKVLKPLSEAIGGWARRADLRWEVRLSPKIPINLEVNTGVTSDTLELAGLQLTGLRVSAGTGKTTLSIPATNSHYAVNISGGTGELTLDVPRNADIDLKLSNGTGSTNLRIGDGCKVEASISGGLGASTIDVPGGAAVRLKASTGLGSIHVPDHFKRVKGGDDFISTSGTWETSGFELAARKITLNYSGGIGKLSVRSGPPIV